MIMKKPDGAFWMLTFVALIVVFGVMQAVYTARDAAISADLASRGVTTEATVVAVVNQYVDNGEGGGVTWTYVTVAFTDRRGAHVQATGAGRSAPNGGDTLTIRHDPPKP